MIGIWVGMQAVAHMAPLPQAQPFRGQGSLPRVASVGNWNQIHLTPAQRDQFMQILASLPASMQPILVQMGPRLSVDTDSGLCDRDPEAGCLDYRAETINGRTSKITKYSLHLPPDSFDGSKGGSFLILHEIGHAIDFMGVSDHDLLVLLRSRPGWAQKWPPVRNQELSPGWKLDITEMWAEEWAMWAAESKSYSIYAAPRLGKTDGAWGNALQKHFKATFPDTKFN